VIEVRDDEDTGEQQVSVTTSVSRKMCAHCAQYLVKWRDLPYENVTWETAGDITDDASRRQVREGVCCRERCAHKVRCAD
jgi:hypothetical protein